MAGAHHTPIVPTWPPPAPTSQGGQIVGTATATTGAAGATTLSLILPSGIQAGDMIFVLTAHNTPDPASVPTGYADIGGAPVGQTMDSDVFWKTAADTSDSGATVAVTVNPVPGPASGTLTPGGGGTITPPPVNPGNGSGARFAAGIHADANIYEANTPTVYDHNNSAVPFARGANFAGFNASPQVVGTTAGPPRWYMIEFGSDMSNVAFVMSQLVHCTSGSGGSNTGDFSTGLGMTDNSGVVYPVPRLLVSLYGGWSNPAASPSTIGAGGPTIDGALQKLCDALNTIVGSGPIWPQVAIRYGWECELFTNFNASDVQGYVNAFRHVRSYMSANLKMPVLWEWNAFSYRGAIADDSLIGNFTPFVSSNHNGQGFNTAQYYPGDAYVDIVGCDSYQVGGPAGDGSNLLILPTMQQAQIFAARHGKQVAYSEWGLWDGYTGQRDANGTPILGAQTLEVGSPSVSENAMHAVLNYFDSLPATGPGSLAYHMFFDGNPGPSGYFEWQDFPKALVIYKARMKQA